MVSRENSNTILNVTIARNSPLKYYWCHSNSCWYFSILLRLLLNVVVSVNISMFSVRVAYFHCCCSVSLRCVIQFGFSKFLFTAVVKSRRPHIVM